MQCINCGVERAPNSERCPHCGAPASFESFVAQSAVKEMICPSCGKACDAAAKACPSCGAAFDKARESAPQASTASTTRCGVCDAECFSDLVQCWHCGAMLHAAEAPAAESSHENQVKLPPSHEAPAAASGVASGGRVPSTRAAPGEAPVNTNRPPDPSTGASMRARHEPRLGRTEKGKGENAPPSSADRPRAGTTPGMETKSAAGAAAVPPWVKQDSPIEFESQAEPFIGPGADARTMPPRDRTRGSPFAESAAKFGVFIAFLALGYIAYQRLGPVDYGVERARAPAARNQAMPPVAPGGDVASSAVPDPGLATHTEPVPTQTTPAQTRPGEPVPTTSAPAQAAPTQTAPAQVAPAQVAPADAKPVAMKREDEAKSVPLTPKSGRAVYLESCSGCHDAGGSRGPSLANVESWTERLAHGRDSLYASVINGKGAMKPRGGNPALRDDDIRAAVDYMTDRLINLSVERAYRKGFSMENGPGIYSTTLPAAEEQPPGAVAASDWRAQLQLDLARCNDSPGSFGQGVCIDMVRWKHCAPNRWGKYPECPEPSTSSGTRLTR